MSGTEIVASGRGRRRLPTRLLALTVLLLPACRVGSPPPTPGERAAAVQAALARGAAHSEIGDWEAALALFREAAADAPNEPAVAFDLALALLRTGKPAEARPWLERIDDATPGPVRARGAFLSGKLALEEGDSAAEVQAYRRAAALDPAEPVYPYALSQVLPRSGRPEADAETGELLETAHRLWPANSRLATELAQWLFGRPDAQSRRRALELLERLAAESRRAEIADLVDRGRAEAAAGSMAETPRALRQALNLLRPSKRFQKDSAELEARLQVLPYSEPLSAELRTLPARPAPPIGFAAVPLLPNLPFGSETEVLQVVASNDAVEPPAGALREADLTLLTDRDLWFLGRSAMVFERLAGDLGGGGRIVVAELDGDGWMEIALLGERGVRLFGRREGEPWSQRDLDPVLARSSLRQPLAVDFEHDGDLDLLAIDAANRLILVTHRGEAGWGAPEAAPLPVEIARGPLLATDLDGDADQDLAVGGESALTVLTNWRQGEFVIAAELPLPGPVDGLVSFDHDLDGRFDLAAAVAGRLLVWRNSAELGLLAAPLGEASDPTAGPIGHVAVGDLDLDGGLDLIAAEAAGATTRLVRRSSAAGGLAAAAAIGSVDGGIDGLAVLDLDDDQAPDLLAWGDGGLTTFRGESAVDRPWLVLGLRGLRGKVPLDGRGARVTVSWGVASRTREVDRPEILLGLGDRPPALVKVTWPNGISEYLHRPAAATRHPVEQLLRIEGSCPFLYAWDGERTRFVTDILGLSPVGMLAAPDRYVVPDPEEYVRLPDWVVPRDGLYELWITEELREVAYIDQSELVVVDAPREIEVYNGERWIEPPARGLDLRLLGALEAPISVIDDRGREVVDRLAAADHRYLTNHRRDRLYQGAVPPHSLTIELPARLVRSGRAALVLVGWLHWGNTSVNVARAQDPNGAPLFPILEIPDGRGGWRRTGIEVGLPAGKTKPVVVELGDAIDAGDPRVRLTTDFEVYWDRIAATEILDSRTAEHRESRLAPAVAELRFGGFSRWYRPAPNGPYLFDYADRRPLPWRSRDGSERPISWREHAGFYTAYGPVGERLERADDRLVIFGSGEELVLRFDASGLPALPAGWRRTLFLHSEGWEKDGDPNVACAETVAPLPYRGMTADPCAGGTAAVALSKEGHDRWVDGERLERRLRSSGR